MMNKEAGSYEGDIEKDGNAKQGSVLESMGKFDRAAAEKAVADYQNAHAGGEKVPEAPETPEPTPEESIDYSCFDQLNGADYSNLPEEQRKEILAQCEAAYDASLEDFTHYGEFSDPDTGRYNGAEYLTGLAGAKRGVDEIVSCAANEESWQRTVNERQAKVDSLSGFHLFGRSKIEAQRREAQSSLNFAKMKLQHCQEWPDYIGERVFGSMEKWKDDEVQAKYKHMVQMKRDIGKVKYPWANKES